MVILLRTSARFSRRTAFKNHPSGLAIQQLCLPGQAKIIWSPCYSRGPPLVMPGENGIVGLGRRFARHGGRVRFALSLFLPLAVCENRVWAVWPTSAPWRQFISSLLALVWPPDVVPCTVY